MYGPLLCPDAKPRPGQTTRWASINPTPSPFWENSKIPHTAEWMRTFCIIMTAANELVGQIHNRMPVILPPDAYDRWLANIEPDPRDLLVPFPSELMKMWPISTRVNKPANDDEGILEPVEAGDDSALL